MIRKNKIYDAVYKAMVENLPINKDDVSDQLEDLEKERVKIIRKKKKRKKLLIENTQRRFYYLCQAITKEAKKYREMYYEDDYYRNK